MSDLVLLAIITLCNGGLGCIEEASLDKPKTVAQALAARKKADEVLGLQRAYNACDQRMYLSGYPTPGNEEAELKRKQKEAAECRLELQKKIDKVRGRK